MEKPCLLRYSFGTEGQTQLDLGRGPGSNSGFHPRGQLKRPYRFGAREDGGRRTRPRREFGPHPFRQASSERIIPGDKSLSAARACLWVAAEAWRVVDGGLGRLILTRARSTVTTVVEGTWRGLVYGRREGKQEMGPDRLGAVAQKTSSGGLKAAIIRGLAMVRHEREDWPRALEPRNGGKRCASRIPGEIARVAVGISPSTSSCGARSRIQRPRPSRILRPRRVGSCRKFWSVRTAGGPGPGSSRKWRTGPRARAQAHIGDSRPPREIVDDIGVAEEKRGNRCLRQPRG